jgi:heptaprenyl diphosphate synthase
MTEHPANDFHANVERRLTDALKVDDASPYEAGAILNEAARHLVLAPGAKRARPRLVQLFGQTADAPQRGLEDIAVAAELIHTASLLHDDVVDDGTERRNQPTVNVKWGNVVAVLSGDLVLSTAIQQLRNHSTEITTTAVDCVAEMSKAALLEVRSRARIDLPIDRWKAIAMGKTGALFGWCGRAAALVGDDPDAAQRFERCGNLFGVAFQMADDIKDLAVGNANKTRFADILNHNPSYPLLYAAQRSGSIRQRIERAWSNGSIDEAIATEIGAAVINSGAVDETWRQVKHHLDQAFESLGPYAERPGMNELAAWATTLWKHFSTKPVPQTITRGQSL